MPKYVSGYINVYKNLRGFQNLWKPPSYTPDKEAKIIDIETLATKSTVY